MNGQIRILKPRKALNKAFLKVKPNRTEIECFKTNLSQLLDRINDNESEEFHKNLLSDFLKKTYYEPNHFINTKGRNDLVIHNTNSASGTVGVIIEAKKPANKTEMMKAPSPGDTQGQMLSRINVKAFQELVLYYLRERVTNKNIEIKHLIATNINEWFIFDAMLFDRLFAQNKNLVKQFNDFESGRLADTKTDFFYKQVAEPFIAEIKHEIEFTYFDIREYEKPLLNTDKQDDNQLIALFKLLSPEHLLKLPFANDSNSLDKRFYGELLHIIGLTETKEGGKKLIERNKEGERHIGSFIENAIIQIDSLDKISRLENANQFGANLQEKLFSVALELSITWINRILFLKLLEAQLISYHKGDKSYGFLSNDKIKDYDDLNSLFFQVLARKQNERNEDVRAVFSKVPYLNSSLFEPTDIEHATIFISNLRDDRTIPIYPQTVLKDSTGKKQTGIINPLIYLFEFLNAYDFTSEGSEEIQEDNKTLINASVLGLIFEKINGYKDGSFFTPGFITMYMCRETIRKAVVQKFNEKKAWNCTDIKSLYDKIEDRNEANIIINDLKICDPAVGSGHFLVSALNEIIAIKSELGILMDIDGRLLRDIQIEVVNDELQVVDIEDDELFFYLAPAPRKELTTRNKFNGDTHNVKPEKIPHRQLIQQSLFKEKQFIIENCLFGVDINPNSVKICRLRLWIELLKNTYYTPESNYTELETLPNIDINIKCGNSLISRYPLNANLKLALKSSKWSIESYRLAISTYRNTNDKNIKREMEKLILHIKQDFTSEIRRNDPLKSRMDKLANELYNRFTGNFLFEPEEQYSKKGDDLNKKRKKEQQKLEAEIKELTQKIEEIKNNKIYENAFEWRFEFPEVLDNNGDFIGFDVVIGNPPYIPLEAFAINNREFFNNKYSQLERKYETSVCFILEGLSLLNKKGLLTYIAPVTWQTGENYSKFRNYFFKNFGIEKLINLPFNIFEDAYVDTAIYFVCNELKSEYSIYAFDKKAKVESLKNLEYNKFKVSDLKAPDLKVINNKTVYQFSRFDSGNFIQFGSITKSTQGLSGSNFPETNKEESEFIFPFLAKGNVYNYYLVKDSIYNTDLTDKKNLIQFYQAEPKILIRRIISRQDRLSVTFCCEKLVFKKDINPFIIIDDKFDCLFLTGIIASKLISFIYLNSSAIATKDDFRQTTLTELRKLPIPNINSEYQKPIRKIIKKILEIKSENSNTDTSNLENEVDQLVYQLYDLTEEEIAIIENSVK